MLSYFLNVPSTAIFSFCGEDVHIICPQRSLVFFVAVVVVLELVITVSHFTLSAAMKRDLDPYNFINLYHQEYISLFDKGVLNVE